MIVTERYMQIGNNILRYVDEKSFTLALNKYIANGGYLYLANDSREGKHLTIVGTEIPSLIIAKTVALVPVPKEDYGYRLIASDEGTGALADNDFIDDSINIIMEIDGQLESDHKYCVKKIQKIEIKVGPIEWLQ